MLQFDQLSLAAGSGRGYQLDTRFAATIADIADQMERLALTLAAWMCCPGMEQVQRKFAGDLLGSAESLCDNVAAATAAVVPGQSCRQVHQACDSHSCDEDEGLRRSNQDLESSYLCVSDWRQIESSWCPKLV